MLEELFDAALAAVIPPENRAQMIQRQNEANAEIDYLAHEIWDMVLERCDAASLQTGKSDTLFLQKIGQKGREMMKKRGVSSWNGYLHHRGKELNYGNLLSFDVPY
jgi:hypothetical protein